MELDRNGLRILSAHQCLSLLRMAHVARVALPHNAIPTLLPVLCRVSGQAVTFRASGGLLATAARQCHVVCFEADFAGPDDEELWSVLIVGQLGHCVSADAAGRHVANSESAGDMVALSGRMPEHPPLLRAQGAQSGILGRRALQPLLQAQRRLVIDHRFTLCDASDGIDDGPATHLLQHAARRARRDHLEQRSALYGRCSSPERKQRFDRRVPTS